MYGTYQLGITLYFKALPDAAEYVTFAIYSLGTFCTRFSWWSLMPWECGHHGSATVPFIFSYNGHNGMFNIYCTLQEVHSCICTGLSERQQCAAAAAVSKCKNVIVLLRAELAPPINALFNFAFQHFKPRFLISLQKIMHLFLDSSYVSTFNPEGETLFHTFSAKLPDGHRNTVCLKLTAINCQGGVV